MSSTRLLLIFLFFTAQNVSAFNLILRTPKFLLRPRCGTDTTEDTSMQVEFPLIERALNFYMQHFGESRIHSHFAVPNSSPWPLELQGIRLGPSLLKLFHSNNEARINELKNLGFTAESILEGWDLFYEALSVFRNEFGHARVPVNFVVPHCPPWSKLVWGLKLGAKVASLRTTGRYVRDHQERLKDLEVLGFEWAPREMRRNDNIWGDEPFSRLVTAMLIYRDLLPDKDIGDNFTVPRSSSWPVRLHDLPLGAMVRLAREAQRSSQSNNTTESKSESESKFLNFQKMYSALQTFKCIYGNCQVPSRFIVPNLLDWSFHLHGFPLGKTLEMIKANPSLLTPQQMCYLHSLGFILDSEEEETTSQIMRPSKLFDQTFQFDIPEDCELVARSLTTLLRERARSHDARVRQTALIEGSLSAEDFANVLSQKLSEEDLIRLQQRGYRVLEFGQFDWDDVVESLNAFRQRFGHVDVAQNFSITPALLSCGFSSSCVGLHLGEAVKAIRMGDVDTVEDEHRVHQLNLLEFDWGDRNKALQFRFFPMWLALKQFMYIFGHVVVPYDFVVPTSAEWPAWMTNIPLGRWTVAAKQQQHLLMTHYPERKKALDAFDFDWSISPEFCDLFCAAQ